MNTLNTIFKIRFTHPQQRAIIINEQKDRACELGTKLYRLFNVFHDVSNFKYHLTNLCKLKCKNICSKLKLKYMSIKGGWTKMTLNDKGNKEKLQQKHPIG